MSITLNQQLKNLSDNNRLKSKILTPIKQKNKLNFEITV